MKGEWDQTPLFYFLFFFSETKKRKEEAGSARPAELFLFPAFFPSKGVVGCKRGKGKKGSSWEIKGACEETRNEEGGKSERSHESVDKESELLTHVETWSLKGKKPFCCFAARDG